MMKNTELVTRATDIARNHKTTYIWGGIGNLITEASVQRAERQYSKNIAKGYASAARKLIGKNAFYFDCVGLIKSILWGWNGDPNKSYGGAKYATNGVPDIGADAMIRRCSGVSSTGWVNMVPGEVLWMPGHIGIYIGGGLAVEATPSWNNGVQISAVKNIGTKAGYNARKWTKHGKLPWVEYAKQATSDKTSDKTSEEVEEVTQEQFDKMMDSWLARQAAKAPTAQWQKDGLARAKAAGITDGSRPMALCTRLEAAIMVHNAGK